MGEVIPDLLLGAEFRLQRIAFIAGWHEEFAPDLIGGSAKNLCEHFVVYEWSGQAVMVEQDAPFRKFVRLDWNGRDEISKNAFNGMGWTAPDAKETKDVINAKGIKIV